MDVVIIGIDPHKRTHTASALEPGSHRVLTSVEFDAALGAHSRRVVGWSIDSSQTAALATNALGMAIANRAPRPDAGTVIHSDHGVQGGFNRSSQQQLCG